MHTHAHTTCDHSIKRNHGDKNIVSARKSTQLGIQDLRGMRTHPKNLYPPSKSPLTAHNKDFTIPRREGEPGPIARGDTHAHSISPGRKNPCTRAAFTTQRRAEATVTQLSRERTPPPMRAMCNASHAHYSMNAPTYTYSGGSPPLSRTPEEEGKMRDIPILHPICWRRQVYGPRFFRPFAPHTCCFSAPHSP